VIRVNIIVNIILVEIKIFMLIIMIVNTITVITVKMEVAKSTKILASYMNTWHHNPEDLKLNLHCHENLKS